jgi:predicted patatin/cPLA2 family phospholipase
MKFLSILILLALSSMAAAIEGNCYALALEGGGDKGAYQVGALAEIVENSDPSEVQYDVVSGVSIGSINGALLAGFPKGEERNATDLMIETWKELTQNDIYKEWPWGGAARGLLFKPALYDSSPFRKYIRSKLSAPKRGFLVSATNASTGAQKTWDETYDWETLVRAIDASSSYPGFFEPIQDLDNTTYYDGGTSFSVNIFGAINKCIDKGYKHNQIVIDVILCSGGAFQDKDVSKYTSIPMVLRFLEIERYYDTMELLERAKADFVDVNFRYTIVPTEKLEPSPLPMVFNHDQIVKMIGKGREDARKAMQLGHNKSTEYILEYTKLKMNSDYAKDYEEFLTAKMKQ